MIDHGFELGSGTLSVKNKLANIWGSADPTGSATALQLGQHSETKPHSVCKQVYMTKSNSFG